ncbi:oocyte zinc finger protein XlCOF7.1-like [Histoplasma ohiense]|nr:oocyte zinc finger protein XlCOF7.1-like [Histoplasma ohiense (nom. inval.)]
MSLSRTLDICSGSAPFYCASVHTRLKLFQCSLFGLPPTSTLLGSTSPFLTRLCRKRITTCHRFEILLLGL